MVIFVQGRIVPEHRNPINRFLIWIYRPVEEDVDLPAHPTPLLGLIMLQLGGDRQPFSASKAPLVRCYYWQAFGVAWRHINATALKEQGPAVV
jgi:hypothetical protein